MTKVIIIGSGLAGYICARDVRQENPDIDMQMICSDQGYFYSKPLLSTALQQQKQPDELITHDANEMAERYQMDITTDTAVKSIDCKNKQVITANTSYAYDKLIIATGAIPRTLNHTWESIDGVQHINHLEDYRVFRSQLKPQQMVSIVGSGLVGVEYANDLLLSGYSVRMFSIVPWPLYGLVSKEIALSHLSSLKDKGLEWIETSAITSIESNNNDLIVSTHETNSYASQQVLLATGFVPNITLAKEAGLTCRQGIVTNQYAQTSDSDIFALGDCAEPPNGSEFYISAIRKSAYAIARNLQTATCPIQSKLTPIVIKSPIQPTVVCFKNNQRQGQWQSSGQTPNIVSELMNDKGELVGFSLSGSAIEHKAQQLRKLDGEL